MTAADSPEGQQIIQNFHLGYPGLDDPVTPYNAIDWDYIHSLEDEAKELEQEEEESQQQEEQS